MRHIATLFLVTLAACAVAPDPADLPEPEIPVDYRSYTNGERSTITIVSVGSDRVCDTMAYAICLEQADRCGLSDVDACTDELAADCLACTGDCEVEAPNLAGWEAIWERCFDGLNAVSCPDLEALDDEFPLDCVGLVPRWLRA